MVGDLDCRKSTFGYLFTFAGELYHGSQSHKNVFHFLLKKQSILQLLKLEKKCYG